MYWKYNEGKSVVAGRFIRTLKNNVLDDIVNKYNNTVHRTNKMKPIEVSNDYDAKNPSMELHPNKKEPKFKIGDNIRISKYKSIFAKGYTPNWSQEVFIINKIKNTVPGTYVLVIWMVKKFLEVFMRKNCKKLIKKNLQ